MPYGRSRVPSFGALLWFPDPGRFCKYQRAFSQFGSVLGPQLTMKDKKCKAIKVSKPEIAGFFTMHSQLADIMVFFQLVPSRTSPSPLMNLTPKFSPKGR
jgi:hypothetical protein